MLAYVIFTTSYGHLTRPIHRPADIGIIGMQHRKAKHRLHAICHMVCVSVCNFYKLQWRGKRKMLISASKIPSLFIEVNPLVGIVKCHKTIYHRWDRDFRRLRVGCMHMCNRLNFHCMLINKWFSILVWILNTTHEILGLEKFDTRGAKCPLASIHKNATTLTSHVVDDVKAAVFICL